MNIPSLICNDYGKDCLPHGKDVILQDMLGQIPTTTHVAITA